MDIVNIFMMLNMAVAFVSTIWMYSRYRKSKEKLALYFSAFFAGKFFGLIGHAIAFAAAMPGASIFGAFSMSLGLAPLAALFAAFLRPSWLWPVVWINVAGSIFQATWSWYQLSFNNLAPFADPIHVGYTVITHLIFMTGLGVYFLYKIFQLGDKRAKTRTLLIGTGLVLASVTGILINTFFQFAQVWLPINWLGHLLMLIGVLYRVAPDQTSSANKG